ncbi:1,2-phenylacetyl-CoA epoxidase subunit PaaD [Actinomadura keratinilytica]|uniref:Phenylacetate-CoA oxygenase subunit PaaJ n=1 Tax=Actinomadura keratinilytica TaxID=547461 RepID=A0ABP7YG64_9ACTN
MVTGDRVAASAVEAPAAAEARAAEARAVAETVTDPELPMLTLRDLGVLRDVRVAPDGAVQVTITPTYTGCPAVQTMRDDLRARLAEAGFTRVEVRTVLHPPWTTDMISKAGRRKLAAAGIAPPGPAPRRTSGPIPLTLGPPRTAVRCPRCGSPDTDELSRFGSTACKSLRRCRACREPFEHFKEI